MASKFKLLLEFSWVSSGDENIVYNLWLWEGLYLFSVVGSGDLVMVGRRWLWVVAVK